MQSPTYVPEFELWRGSVDVLSPEHFPEEVREYAPTDAVRVRIYYGLTGEEHDFTWIFDLSDGTSYTMLDGMEVVGTLAECEKALYAYLYL